MQLFKPPAIEEKVPVFVCAAPIVILDPEMSPNVFDPAKVCVPVVTTPPKLADAGSKFNTAPDKVAALALGVLPIVVNDPNNPVGPVGPAGPAPPVGPAGPAPPVGPAAPVGPVKDKLDLVLILPVASATNISVSVVPEGVSVSCSVLNLASDPLTINFFQFGMSMFLLWLVTQKEPTSVWPIISVINIKYYILI